MNNEFIIKMILHIANFIIFSYSPGGNNDEPAIETKFAPYGSSLEMDCRIDHAEPIQFQWNKLGGLLPRDAQTLEVYKMYIIHQSCIVYRIYRISYFCNLLINFLANLKMI